MKTHLRSTGRLLSRLLLLAGLLVGLGLLAGRAATPAHAATTFTVGDCSNDSQLQADVSKANSDNAGDTITFACSGDIPLHSTLSIRGSMTLDGSGQSVTLDGNNAVIILYVYPGDTLTLNALTLINGYSRRGPGGAIFNVGTVNISNSTFAYNVAYGAGGAVLNNGGMVSISDSTFAYNVAGSAGGAIYNAYSSGTVSIANSTFAYNSASLYDGGAIDNEGGTVNIAGSIVADNTAPTDNDCFNLNPTTDKGYNLESGKDCGFTDTGSKQNTNPLLASALANNGGPTQTLALLQGSLAINAIPLSANLCPSTDQRGYLLSGTTCDMGAYQSNYLPPDHDLSLANMPTDITVNANGPQGAVVTYTPPTVVDEDSPLPTVSCLPASGSTFPIGTTKVTCTVSDSDDANSPVSASFTVTVNDTDLGLTNMPANITTDATSPQGAVVTYILPTVVDEDSPLPSVSCNPASGSTFAIDTTTVTCTVSDSDDANSPVSGSFRVVVVGASGQVSALINLVNSFHLSPPGIQTSFDSQLQAVQADLAGNNTAQACSDLASFISHAQAQSGKHLTTDQANQMIAAAKQIQAVLGC